jgi:hypothetical protein
MKKIKKLEFTNDDSFKVIENGLSANQLSRFELASLTGGLGFDDYGYCGDTCGIKACGANGCIINL